MNGLGDSVSAAAALMLPEAVRPGLLTGTLSGRKWTCAP